jgi:hypothetical protein
MRDSKFFLGEMKMKKMKWTVTTLAASLLIMTFAAASQATVLRAFVSSTGNDANIGTNCVQATPCKTFNVAIGAVTPGGELIALDTSGYGPIANINKAITIATVPGATAFVVAATGTSGFTINGASTDQIILRNINFNGSNAASTTGITHNSGNVSIDNCTFQQLANAITIVNAKMDLRNSALTNNTTAVRVSGVGTDTQGGSAATALLTISGGSIAFNGTAFVAINPGTNPVFNIFILTANNATFTSIVGNTTVFFGVGAGCPCTQIGFFSNFNNPR